MKTTVVKIKVSKQVRQHKNQTKESVGAGRELCEPRNEADSNTHLTGLSDRTARMGKEQYWRE